MMNEGTVKAELSSGSDVVKGWEQPCQTELPKVIEAVTHLKQSINDYLTNMISSEKDTAVKELTEMEEDIEEEGDNITEFIKDVAKETPSRSEKRKSNFSNQTKKIRK